MSMGKAAAGVIAIPSPGLEREKIMREIKMDRYALTRRPIHIRVEKKLGAGIGFGTRPILIWHGVLRLRRWLIMSAGFW